jgi:uncharacterized membrane protein YeaQ/YmgE (transglycosylase-associated protein family)
MTLPALLLGLVIALLAGALYHTARGGGGGRLLAFLVVSAVGFTAGQALGMFTGWEIYKFGWLDVGMGVLGSLLLLMLGDWFTRSPP